MSKSKIPSAGIPPAGRLAPICALLTFLALACADDASPNAPGGGTITPEETLPMGNPPMGGPDSLAGPGLSLPEILDPSVEGADLRARLAAPLRVEAAPYPNRHVEGQIDTLRTLVYDGLTLEFYEVAGGPTFLQTVEVTGGVYETAEGLGVGSTRGEVEAVYTNSVGAEGGTTTYERYDGPEDPTPTTLEVRYDGDDVAAMTWRFYVD